MLKKLLVFISCFFLITSTVGCGSENKTTSTTHNSSTNSFDSVSSSQGTISDKTTSTDRTVSSDNVSLNNASSNNNSNTTCPCNHSYIPASCEAPKKCEKCGDIAQNALGHNFVNNLCSRNGCNTANFEWYEEKEVTITKAEAEEIISMPYRKPKNVILMIGDGMGPNDIILTENYSSYCFDFGLVLNQIKHTGFSTTRSNDSSITDSAAAATALATGFKTNNTYIGISPTGEILTNVSEIARQKGKRVGIVTNDSIVGATPSAFAVHANSRENYEQIASSFVSFAPDVLIGQDRSYFSSLSLDHFIVANNFSDFNNSLNKNFNPNKPFLGFFSEDVTTKDSLNTLAYCTEVALNRLKINSPNGFFLMVENTTCDDAGHANNINAKLNGVVTLDRAVVSALRFMKDNPDTLLIITSDHESGGVKLPSGNLSPDASLFTTTWHTSANVRTFALGYGAEYFNNKTLDNTDIAKFIINAVSN